MEENQIEKEIDANGLEAFLKNCGVSTESIQQSKFVYSYNKREYQYYYDYIGENENSEEVPVSQIKGVSRVSGYTWYEYIFYGVNGIPKEIPSKDINLSTVKFLNLLLIIKKSGVAGFKSLCENTSGIRFDCYIKSEKKEFFQHTDGNHRTILAKVLGVPYIKCTKMHMYKLNKEKYIAFSLFKERHFQTLDLIKTLGLEIKFNKIAVVYNNTKYICDYPFDVDLLSENVLTAYKMCESMDIIENFLPSKKQIDRYVFILKKLPKWVSSFIWFIIDNKNNDLKTKDYAILLALKKIQTQQLT